MSKTGLWPRQRPRPTESQSEVKIFDALAKQLPASWTAWHSLRIRTEEGLEGEGDFVIAIPGRGILVLEVKGGLMEMRDGLWYQNGHLLENAPRDQAFEYARKLSTRLKELGSLSVPYGILTIFPDTSFSSPVPQDNLRDLVLGEQDLPWLVEAIEAKLDRAFPPEFLVPESNWISLLHQIWGETWIPRVRLGHRATVNAEERYRLDQRQFELIESLIGNDRLRIEGVAGSGKTLLAREAALRSAAEGKKVLSLCFTDALARWLAASIEEKGIRVATVPRYAAELLLQRGMISSSPETAEAWKSVSLSAAAELSLTEEERPEVLIVDEAQDLSENDWLFVHELSVGARTWVFHDTAQAFWHDRELPQEIREFPSYRLFKSYRCPEPIQELSKALSGLPHDQSILEKGKNDGVIGMISCPSATSVEAKVENEIRKLRSEGFADEDIAVLSLRGQSAEGIGFKGKIGSFEVVRADSPDIDQRIVADTFLRFKGLERPAVIVTDLAKVSNRFDVRMHIALTRALDVARVVGYLPPGHPFEHLL